MRAQRVRLQDVVFRSFEARTTASRFEGSQMRVQLRRAATDAAVDYALDAMEQRDTPWRPKPVPLAINEHARRAARTGIDLGSLLHHYVAGCHELARELTRTSHELGVYPYSATLYELRERLDEVLEELARTLKHEFTQTQRRWTPDERRRAIAQRLLASDELTDDELSELDYEVFGAWHVGIVVTGQSAPKALEALTHADRRLLVVARGRAAWAWVGEDSRFSAEELRGTLCQRAPAVTASVGDCRRGLAGWRQTHREARSALPLAASRRAVVRYADDPLLAAAAKSETLAEWLRSFVTPLTSTDGQRLHLVATLRAFIDAECSRTSAAAAIGVSRHTVESRLRAAERLIGRSVRDCLTELDIALRLVELDSDERDARLQPG
jgi:DNA-binding PucR family transcriptional regulator